MTEHPLPYEALTGDHLLEFLDIILNIDTQKNGGTLDADIVFNKSPLKDMKGEDLLKRYGTRMIKALIRQVVALLDQIGLVQQSIDKKQFIITDTARDWYGLARQDGQAALHKLAEYAQMWWFAQLDTTNIDTFRTQAISQLDVVDEVVHKQIDAAYGLLEYLGFVNQQPVNTDLQEPHLEEQIEQFEHEFDYPVPAESEPDEALTEFPMEANAEQSEPETPIIGTSLNNESRMLPTRGEQIETESTVDEPAKPTGRMARLFGRISGQETIQRKRSSLSPVEADTQSEPSQTEPTNINQEIESEELPAPLVIEAPPATSSSTVPEEGFKGRKPRTFDQPDTLSTTPKVPSSGSVPQEGFTGRRSRTLDQPAANTPLNRMERARLQQSQQPPKPVETEPKEPLPSSSRRRISEPTLNESPLDVHRRARAESPQEASLSGSRLPTPVDNRTYGPRSRSPDLRPASLVDPSAQPAIVLSLPDGTRVEVAQKTLDDLKAEKRITTEEALEILRDIFMRQKDSGDETS